MLYCEDCSYLKDLKNVNQPNHCKMYRCDYSDFVLSYEDIINFTEYPCGTKKFDFYDVEITDANKI
jgi:hypothetical protein